MNWPIRIDVFHSWEGQKTQCHAIFAQEIDVKLINWFDQDSDFLAFFSSSLKIKTRKKTLSYCTGFLNTWHSLFISFWAFLCFLVSLLTKCFIKTWKFALVQMLATQAFVLLDMLLYTFIPGFFLDISKKTQGRSGKNSSNFSRKLKQIC